MSTFNLRERAEELFGVRHLHARTTALQLATEALEAAAKECEALEHRYQRARPDWGAGWKSGVWHSAAIIRSFIEKPGASPHPSGDSSDKAADNLGSRTAERTSQPPAPLSDAEILERAVEISKRERIFDRVGNELMQENADRLRAAEEVDVFEAFADLWCGAERDGSWPAMRATLSEYFGPLVEALEHIGTLNDGPLHGRTDRWRREKAIDALSALRARARAAGGKP